MAKAVVLAEPEISGLDRLKSAPERLRDFLKDVRSEMRKVITPSRPEVQATTTVVIVTVFLFAAYFWLVDTLIGRTIEAILHKLTLRS